MLIMNINTLLSRIPLRYWGYLSLSLWGVAILFLLRPDLYNLDEGSAKSLLLVWSIADQVAASVVTLLFGYFTYGADTTSILKVR